MIESGKIKLNELLKEAHGTALKKASKSPLRFFLYMGVKQTNIVREYITLLKQRQSIQTNKEPHEMWLKADKKNSKQTFSMFIFPKTGKQVMYHLLSHDWSKLYAALRLKASEKASKWTLS